MMEKTVRIIIFSSLAIALCNAGCDDKKSAKTNRQPQTAPRVTLEQMMADDEKEVIGKWETTVGDPTKQGQFSSKMTIELRADKSFFSTNEMSNEHNSNQPIVNKAQGTWSRDGEYYNVVLEKSLDGREIPADQKKMKFIVYADRDAHHLTLLPSGPRFTKVAAK